MNQTTTLTNTDDWTDLTVSASDDWIFADWNAYIDNKFSMKINGTNSKIVLMKKSTDQTKLIFMQKQ